MYDFYKEATIELSPNYLSEMMTQKARDLEIIDEKYFIVVKNIEIPDSIGDDFTLVTECDIFKYMEN